MFKESIALFHFNYYKPIYLKPPDCDPNVAAQHFIAITEKILEINSNILQNELPFHFTCSSSKFKRVELGKTFDVS